MLALAAWALIRDEHVTEEADQRQHYRSFGDLIGLGSSTASSATGFQLRREALDFRPRFMRQPEWATLPGGDVDSAAAARRAFAAGRFPSMKRRFSGDQPSSFAAPYRTFNAAAARRVFRLRAVPNDEPDVGR